MVKHLTCVTEVIGLSVIFPINSFSHLFIGVVSHLICNWFFFSGEKLFK